MILTMLVSLYTSRVVLNTLGVEDFGIYIYNVVGVFVTMFGFLNSAMASATQRFLAFDSSMDFTAVDNLKKAGFDIFGINRYLKRWLVIQDGIYGAILPLF